MLDQFPEWFQIFLLSMIPGFEARYVVPFAMFEFGWDWWKVFPIAVFGNVILVPFFLLFFHSIEKFFKRFSRGKVIINWVFSRVRSQAGSKVQKYESLALVILVAIPLPPTGAGVGIIVAYLFDLPLVRSFIMILIGVLISATITTLIYLAGWSLFFS